MPPCCTEPDGVLAWLAPGACSTDEPVLEQFQLDACSACSYEDPVPAPPTGSSAWNCTCTAPMTDRRVETAWLRPQASHQALRPHWRPSMRSAAVALASSARSISRREKKGECVQGLFFLSGFAPLAGHAATPQTTTQVQVVLGEAVLRRGAVAGAIRGTAIAVHRRRNTDPPAMAGQPAVGTP